MLNGVSLLILVLPLTHGAMTVHTFGSSDAAVGKLAAAYEKSATVIFGPILSHPDAMSDVYIYDAAREATDKATWVTAICNNKMHNSGQDLNCARLYNDRPSMQTIAAAGACGPPGTADLSKCAGMVMHAGFTSGASSNLAESLVIPQQTFDLPSPLEGEGCCVDGGEKVAIHESWHLVSSYITTSYTTRGGFAGGNPESGTAQPYFGPYWLEEGIAEYVALTRAALIPGYGYNLTQTLAHSFTARRQQLLAHPECRLAGMRFLGEASWDGPCAGKVDFTNLGAWATALMVAKNLALPAPAGGEAQGERAILVDLLVETSQRNLMPGVGFKEKVGMTVAAFEEEVEALFLATPPLSAAALFDKLFPKGPPTSVCVDFTGLTVALDNGKPPSGCPDTTNNNDNAATDNTATDNTPLAIPTPGVPSIVPGQQSTCSQLGWTNIVNNVCGESDLGISGGCQTASKADAETICSNAGARLCSTEEVNAGAVKSTGCSFDSGLMWTDTWCGLGPEGGKFYTAIGGGNNREWKCKNPKKAYNVRCCSDVSLAGATSVAATTTTTFPFLSDRQNCASLGWTVTGNACGESDRAFKKGLDHCFTNKNHPDAERKCLKLGGRMCSQADIEAGVGKATGCGFDSQFLWTSTSCGTNSYIKAKGNGKGETECATVKSKGAMRCCSDVTLSAAKSKAVASTAGKEGKEGKPGKMAHLNQNNVEVSKPRFTSTIAGKIVVASAALVGVGMVWHLFVTAGSSSTDQTGMPEPDEPLVRETSKINIRTTYA